MREYPIPPANMEEEKIFGGYLSLRQVIWLGVGAVLGLIIFAFSALLLNSKAVGLFLFIFCALLGTPFAFKKVDNLSLDRYLLLRYRHQKKRHHLIYKGGE